MSQPQPLNALSLPLNGSTLIEASAGTGKTFTIALLYVRLVLGHGQSQPGVLQQGLEPPRLLVVTFTEAATKELRDRIRKRLTQAAAVFAGTEEPNADNSKLFELRDDYPPQSWPDCRNKLLLAAEWMDEAAVSTIHGWCYRMLSEHAFDSGNLFNLELVTQQAELLDEVVRDYWRSFVYPLDSGAVQTLVSHWKSPQALRKAVSDLLPEADRIGSECADLRQAIERAESLARNRAAELKAYPWQTWQLEVVALLEQLNKAKRLHGGSKNSMLRAWDNLLAWAAGEALLPEGLDLAGMQNQQPDTLQGKLTGDGEAPSHPAFAAIAEILAFAANLPTASSDILRHAAVWISRRLEQEKHKRAEMGFDDLLTRLNGALKGARGPQLAATIRRQFPAAMIDEFQDTDPIQYEIFDRIYRVAENDPHSCFLMIGDPKQAIYGFRGADIFTYLMARHSVRQRTFTLDTNFRSDQAMVSAVNRLFAYADQHNRDGAFVIGGGDQERLPFHPVMANGTRRQWRIDALAQPALQFWTLDSTERKKDGSIKPLSKNAALEALSASCASEIAALLNLGVAGRAGFVSLDDPQDSLPLQARDIAILVNTGGEARAIRAALTARGIKSVYLSDRESVLASVEAKQILHWLRAFAEPQRTDLVRAALATATLGLSWCELDRLLTDELALEFEIERFSGYHQCWQRQGILPTLRNFLIDFDLPGRLLAQSDGERRLTDILHIAELLQEDGQLLDGEQALVHHYTQLLTDTDQQEQHRTIRLESDASLVQVVTVHKSKGLEYPLVFLPFGTSFRAVSEKRDYLRYHDATGQWVTAFDATEAERQLADTERLGEDLRKLYVALTRARYATWVGAAAIDQWQLSGLGYLLGGAALAGQPLLEALAPHAAEDQIISCVTLPPATELCYQPAATELPGPPLEAQRALQENWWIASYSKINYTSERSFGPDYQVGVVDDVRSYNQIDEQDAAPAPGETTGDALGYHSFHRGGGPGDFLHSLLEWCCQQGFAAVLNDPSELSRLVEARCELRGWSEWSATLVRWMLDLIATPFKLPNGDQVSLAQLPRSQAEMEFWFESCDLSVQALDALVCSLSLSGAARPRAQENRFNGMLKGYIDLIFEHQGRYYVLDYKSTWLGETDSAYQHQAMAEMMLQKRYDLQYLIYLLALHRYLRVRLPDYDYERHIGGAVYLFMRGIQADTAGAFCDKPPRELIERMDALFAAQPHLEVSE